MSVQVIHPYSRTDTHKGRWNMLFSLPIPGWLPRSSRFGIENVGTRYALYATARILDLSGHSTCFSVLCSSFHSRQWSINASKSINLKRYDQPPATEAPEVRLSTYSVQCKVLAKTTLLSIPSETFDQLQILASVPLVDIRDHKFPLKINIKALNLDKASCKRLYVTDISIDVVQFDKLRQVACTTSPNSDHFSSRPSQQFVSRFPIPDESHQPPHLPLRYPHYLGLLIEAGLSSVTPPKDGHIEREFSLLQERDRAFKLGENNIFSSDDPSSENSTWLTLETVVPFNRRGPSQSEDEWAGPSKLRPTESGPLFAVQHELRVSLGLTYDFPDGQVATEILYFKVPLRFMHVAPLLPSMTISPTLLVDSPTAPSLPPLIPYALPAYSQLFYSNGERKLDPMPLPLYSLRDPEGEPSQASPSVKEYQVDIEESSEESGLLSNDFP